ncbi:unnamed protein product [Eretmochelys imbricata]
MLQEEEEAAEEMVRRASYSLENSDTNWISIHTRGFTGISWAISCQDPRVSSTYKEEGRINIWEGVVDQVSLWPPFSFRQILNDHFTFCKEQVDLRMVTIRDWVSRKRSSGKKPQENSNR